ncbi:hypothetical protein M0M57_00650 [Flavobacterium azooxidireducens]|uniref:Outer membrane protein beta-barrel domain-containing protein n=1 Tax=Flavobacterium azooxidireducens TaxID=1871076 RepID=A0ABY4KHW3_9FLAO|nr:hypothetical protein [Flavobacterium azooxidireducens]UPQ79363.1 hypothetical protein M0M57_00650 [Flavobacterium azooxidireducens]
MKRNIILKLCVFLSTLYSISSQAQDGFKIKPLGRIYILHAIQQGDNALADAYSSKIGFGGQFFLPKYKNFRLGFGGDYVPYKVEKENMIGTIGSSYYYSVYGLLSYDIIITENFNLSPVIGYGNSTLSLRSNTRKIDPQNGNEFRIGLYSDYTFSPHIAGFVGLYYISNRFTINTHPDYEDYFGKSNSIQLSLGLKFF